MRRRRLLTTDPTPTLTPLVSRAPLRRVSGRVVLVGPGGVALLFRGGDPHRPSRGTWWFTPGGGCGEGEDPAQAVRRELWEETGQTDVEWGPLVARRTGLFEFESVRYRSDEWIWVAFTKTLDVVPGHIEEAEARSVVEHRWLDRNDLSRVSEPVYPEELAGALEQLAARRFPDRPWRWSSTE